MKGALRRVMVVMLFGILLYGAFAIWRGVDSIGESLAHFTWAAFGAACLLAFLNYVLRTDLGAFAHSVQLKIAPKPGKPVVLEGLLVN